MMLGTIEEKYKKIIDDKERIESENYRAKRKSEEVENKLVKFTGKPSHNLSKTFYI